MRMRQDGFSLSELLAGLVIAAIVVLMVSAIGTVSARSYKDLRDRSVADTDTQFVTDMIRAAVRGAPALAVPAVQSGGLALRTDPTHRLYFSTTSGSSLYNLTYENTGVTPAENSRVASGVASSPAPVFTVSGTRLVTAGLTYTKAGVAYNYSVPVTRRNYP